MKTKSFEQFQEEIKDKAILIANRGIPARRISRAISEVSDCTAVITVTDVDKTSPAATGAQELLLLGEDRSAMFYIFK